VWHPLIRAGPGVTTFRRDHDSFPVRIECLCNEQFISFRSVSVRRIDQVRPKFDCASQNFERVLAVWRPTPNPVARQTHRAESKSIDGQIATDAETGVLARRRSREEGHRSAGQKRRSACKSCTKKYSAIHAAASSLTV